MRLLGVVVELMKRSWTRLSRQKVEESSKVEKPQKLEKSAKAIGSEELSFLTSNTRLAFTKMRSSRTHDGELLALLKPLRIGVASTKSILACYSSLQQFRDTKNSSFRQVC